MSREPTFGPDAICSQFYELAERLDESTTVYLIGGGALTLKDLKNATRDIDLIVESTDVSGRLFQALISAGYAPLEEPEAEYDDLDAAFILQSGPRRFDVFNQQVAGVISLTEPMKERSEQLFQEGPLTVRAVSVNDIFLFKSVANREDDVDDMIVLAESGINEDVIMGEVMVQLDILQSDQFIITMKLKLDRLEERDYYFGIHDAVADVYDVVQMADEVENTLFSIYDFESRRDSLYDGVPRERLIEEVGSNIDTALDWLERINRIREADDGTLVPTRDV